MRFLSVIAGLFAWSASLSAFGQVAIPSRSLQPPPSGSKPELAMSAVKTELVKFDLDFAGGTPRELVRAIEQASGQPLNIVIPIGAAETPLPPLKMKGVTVPELFIALGRASEQTGSSRSRAYGSRNTVENEFLVYTFQTADNPQTDDSVWFFTSRSNEASKSVRFWQLAPYLADYTVDDITTAIQTGYKMLGDAPPSINFHKDTKLLIAVGDQNKLALIDAVLAQLPPSGKSTGDAPGKGTPGAAPGPVPGPKANP